MRVPSNMSRGSVGFNMTPMIDVVFLLIIFFLVSSHLAKQETQLELDLPNATSGRATPDEGVRRVVVNVLSQPGDSGSVQVGGRTLAPDELRQLINYESMKSGDSLEVRIRSDRNVPYRVIEPILVACARAGAWNVTFAVIAGD